MLKEVISGSFVWDLEKERLNAERHGVNFTEAKRAFADPHRLISMIDCTANRRKDGSVSAGSESG
jgi:uncharacterized DUF497 family protein